MELLTKNCNYKKHRIWIFCQKLHYRCQALAIGKLLQRSLNGETLHAAALGVNHYGITKSFLLRLELGQLILV